MSSESKAAKKARNIAEYCNRNAMLRERQILANNLRKEGYLGNDNDVLRRYEQEQEVLRRQEAEAERLARRQAADAKYAARVAAIKAQEQAEQQYVQDSLNGPSGKILKRWLAMRIASYSRVKRFFDERPDLQRVHEKVA
jgi:hypothetical protein